MYILLTFSLRKTLAQTEGVLHQGSPHIVKTNFNVSFPTTACSPTFHKTNMLHNDLKKDAIYEFGIKYWTSNPVWVKFQEHGILKKKYDYWWKKYGLEKTYRATKTSLFDRNWAISLKPRRRSRPLRLVWWALLHVYPCTRNQA